MKRISQSGRRKGARSLAPACRPGPAPAPERLASDALCHMSAALSVLQLHAQRTPSATVFAVRDLLSAYCSKAEHAVAEQPIGDLAEDALPRMSDDLGCAIAILDKVNDGERDGNGDGDSEVLDAVGYLLRAARGLADQRLR